MIAWSLLVGALLAAFSVAEPVPQGPSAGSVQKLEITVRDENEVSVVAAKRFHLCGFCWAIRGGFNDITDHKNPAFVNGDINSHASVILSDALSPREFAFLAAYKLQPDSSCKLPQRAFHQTCRPVLF